MSLTGGSLIQQALLMLNRLYPGESPSSSEQTDALIVANNMLDNWSLERINIPVIVVSAEALTSGTAAYTFGPGGSFGGTRFIRIDTVGILVPSAAISGSYIRLPVNIVSQKEFQAFVVKASASQVPTDFYYDYQFPTATGNLYPTPSFTGTAIELEVGGWQALASFPDLVTTVDTPQGYDRAIVLNFAVELAPQYSVNPSATLVQSAAEAKAALRAMNASNLGQPGQPPPSGPVNAVPPPGGPQPGAAS